MVCPVHSPTYQRLWYLVVFWFGEPPRRLLAWQSLSLALFILLIPAITSNISTVRLQWLQCVSNWGYCILVLGIDMHCTEKIFTQHELNLFIDKFIYWNSYLVNALLNKVQHELNLFIKSLSIKIAVSEILCWTKFRPLQCSSSIV